MFQFFIILASDKISEKSKKKLIYTNECNYNNIIGTNCSAPDVHFDNHCLFSDDRGHLCEKKKEQCLAKCDEIYTPRN